MKKPINEIARMRRIAGLITESEYQEALQEENKFYSRDYVSQKYGNKAKEIEDNIEDENPNVWDMYTSLETPEEVDEFVSGYLDETLQEEKGLVKVGEKVLSQDKKPYWADENLNTIDTKTLTTYTKGDYNIEVVESQFYFEGDEENKISFSVSVKVFKDKNLIKKKLFYPGAERWKGMSIEDFIDYAIQLINGDVNEYQETLVNEVIDSNTIKELNNKIVTNYILDNNLGPIKDIEFSESKTYGKQYTVFSTVITPSKRIYFKVRLTPEGKLIKIETNSTSLKENQSSLLNEMDENYVLSILANNNIDDDYFESMGGKEIEGGTEEWSGVLADLIGNEDVFYDPNYDFNDEEMDKIQQFISKLSDMGIELI
jgi:hypothetical protein